MAESKIKHIESIEDLDAEFAAAGEKLVVVDFFADWCGPCRQISPLITKLSKELDGQVIFLKVNVDEAEESLIVKYEIDAMPTFIFFKGGTKVQDFKGAKGEEFKKQVNALK